MRLELLEIRELLTQFIVTSALDDGSTGTLRDAITQANGAAGADEIVFDTGVSGTITLASGQLSITDTLTITGPGADQLAVSGDHASRVFEITYGVTATLSGLTIRDGVADFHGGGIYSIGTLTVNNCMLTGNSARSDGGAISASGTLTVNNCTLTGNSSAGQGGAISASRTLTVNNCTLTGNSSGGHGGAIYSPGVAVSISNSTLTGNSAGRDGGGVWSFGTLTITNSTLASNSAGYDGGAVWSRGSLSVINSTLAGNRAGHDGGAIYVHENGGGSLRNLTIADNRCNTLDITGTGGGVYHFSLSLWLTNTIVARNFNGLGETADDVVGALKVTSAFNLIGVGGAGGLQDRSIDEVHNNQVGVIDPGLGQLGDNGGLTATIPLLAGSPAVAGGSKGLAFGGGVNGLDVLATDQRGPGFSRFHNGTIDIGAFESQLAPPRVTFTVTNTSDSGPGSLRQSVQDNNLLGGGNTIDFALPSAATITLTSGELRILQDVTVSGPGAAHLTVSGNHASRVFVAYGYGDSLLNGTTSISGMTIENGTAGSSLIGGGVYVNYFAVITVSNCVFSGNTADGGNGGGISNDGTLTVNNSTFAGNSSGVGGAIANFGSLTVNDNTFSNNSSGGGGAIFSNDGRLLTVSNSTFTANSSSGNGGAIYNRNPFSGSRFTVSNSAFTGNSAGRDGGGIYTWGASRLVCMNSTFAYNSAAGRGGGIRSDLPSAGINRLINVTIAHNTAAIGGGIAGPGLRVSNTIIARNTAADSAPDIFGSFLSYGHNLVGDSSGGTVNIFSGAFGDQVGTAENPIDPLLAPLGYYGGSTQTMPPLPGSPAMDAGSNSLAVDASGNLLTTDQRGSGFDRVGNGTVDIGAVESRGSEVIVAVSAPLDGFQGVSGQTRSFALTATDPLFAGPADISTYVVNWGDGSPLEAYPASLSGATAQHAYPAASSYTIYVSAMDGAGGTSAPTTRNVTILSTESQGPVFAVGGTSADDASADDMFTLTLATATTAALLFNTTSLGTFDQSLHPDGVHFFGGTGYDTVVVNGTTAADQFTTTENSVAWNTIVLQGQDVEHWSINALAGNDTITIMSGTPSVDAGTGTDQIIAADVPNLWTISSANTGTLNEQSFTRVENLTGGTDNDVFQYIGTGSLSGRIEGGLGINTLDYSQRPTTVTVNLFNSTASGATGGIANLGIFVGSEASNDTLTAPATTNAWTIVDANIGNLNGVTVFIGFESLVGGSADDTFLLQPSGSIGSLNGGGGTDRLDYSAISTPVTVDLRTVRSATGVGSFASIEQLSGGSSSDDTLQGADAANNWTINGLNAGSIGTISFTGFEAMAGGSVSDTFNLSSGSGQVGVIHGGIGIDTLIGPAAASHWVINDLGSGTLNDMPFDEIEKLTGGAGNDQFVFQGTGDLAGLVNGGGGSDTIDLTALSGPLTIDLGAKTISGLLATFSSIQSFLAPADVLNTLVGSNANSTWSITGVNTGSVAGIQFAGVGRLQGGALNDTFNLTTTGSVEGGIAGGAGTNTLVGPGTDNLWTISGAGIGQLNGLAFQDINNLTGSTGVDTFVFQPNGQVVGVLNGGGGVDVLSLVAVTGPVIVDLQSKSIPGRIGTWASIGSFIGSANPGDTLQGPAANTAWTITGSNTGTAGAIQFSGFESVQGGIGNDTVTMVGAASGLTGSLFGGGGSDTLVGAAQSNLWNVTGAGSGTLNGLVFADIENLTGGSDRDWFEIAPAGSVAGNLNGGTGNNNTLSYANWLTAVEVDLASSSASQIGLTVTNVSIIAGGSGDDTLVGNATRSTILIGNAGSDTLTGGNARDILTGGSGADKLTGGGGSDILIAGGTVYDADAEALLAILAEWNSSRSYANRVGNIGGTLNVGPRLNGSYVLAGNNLLPDPTAVDTLTGGAGQDWFIAGLEDILADLVASGGGSETMHRP